MSWAEAKWIVDSLLQKTGQAPNNMRAFAAFAVSKNSLGLKFLEPADSYSDGNLICSVGGVSKMLFIAIGSCTESKRIVCSPSLSAML